MRAVPETFLDWAIEGECLCKAHRYAEGCQAFTRALAVGTDDVATLSAVYSQLGNAFFTQKLYDKSIEFHLYDLTIARMYGDLTGEAKACGNVANVSRTKGSFNDAITFTERQIELARQTGDKRTESLGFYNLASVHHAKGKQAVKMLIAAVGGDMSLSRLNADLSQEVMDSLNQANEYYKNSLSIANELNDRRAAGRIYGSLGNAFHLLRDYENAVYYHEQRLAVGKEFGDKEAMQRAYSNLGNAYVYMSKMDKAIEFYQLALVLSTDLRDRTAEAQTCFSLANAATLVADYPRAVTYHGRHLSLTRKLGDRAGEARGYSSLSIDYRNIGDLPKAAYFLAKHRKLAKEMKDGTMLEKVEMSLRDLIAEGGPSLCVNDRELLLDSSADPDDHNYGMRLSLSLRSLTEDINCSLSRIAAFVSDSELSARSHSKRTGPTSQEEFFDFLSRVQSKRMDEQRCDAPVLTNTTNKQKRQADAISARSAISTSTPHVKKTKSATGSIGSLLSYRTPSVASFVSAPQCSDATFRVPQLPLKNEDPQLRPEESSEEQNNPEAFMDILMQVQGRRMDEQRAPLLPGLQGGDNIISKLQRSTAEAENFLDDKLIDWLSRMQIERMDEQKGELGGRSNADTDADVTHLSERVQTIPEDDVVDVV